MTPAAETDSTASSQPQPDRGAAAPTPPAAFSPQEVEARLVAHRQLLVHVLSMLIEAHGKDGALPPMLAEDALFKDHQEDPGAVPSSAYAIGGLAGDEMRRLLQDAQTRLAALRRQQEQTTRDKG